jgi:hypothetical protein
MVPLDDCQPAVAFLRSRSALIRRFLHIAIALAQASWIVLKRASASVGAFFSIPPLRRLYRPLLFKFLHGFDQSSRSVELRSQ